MTLDSVVGLHGDAEAEAGGVLLELEDGRRVAVGFGEMVIVSVLCASSARGAGGPGVASGRGPRAGGPSVCGRGAAELRAREERSCATCANGGRGNARGNSGADAPAGPVMSAPLVLSLSKATPTNECLKVIRFRHDRSEGTA